MDTDVTYVQTFRVIPDGKQMSNVGKTWNQGHEDDGKDMSTSLISGSIRGYSQVLIPVLTFDQVDND